MGREPYQSKVMEATDSELAILVEKSSGRKGKKEMKGPCSVACEEEMAGMKRRLQLYEEFMMVWEPKLKKWDTYFLEQEEEDTTSDSEGSEGE